MAIPNNYIDKIKDKDKGESRLICPAAENVRVENENFEADNLDEVLKEIDDTIDDIDNKVVKKVTFNGGNPVTPDKAGNVNIDQAKSDWTERDSNSPKFIEHKPDIVEDVFYEEQTRTFKKNKNGLVQEIMTLPEQGSQVTFDGQMSSTSENGVQNKVIKAYVDAVSQRIDTLLGSGNVQGAIDTFNEVVAFLNGINSSDTLAAKLLLKANSADVYDKQTVDGMVANAGKVKSVSINGTNHTPSSSGVVDLGTIQGEKGDKGDTGNVTVTDGVAQITIVNDLTTGGTGDALSAEMGKRLALMSGTYAQAWARSKAITVPFSWLWVETVNGDAISKPIWHKGNSVFVDAAGAVVSVDAPQSLPLAPEITMSEQPVDGKYPKGTIVTIEPASGSALYYSVDGGSTYKVSDVAVAITLDTAGVTVSIDAYCVNQAGTSATHATQTIVVQGVSTPQWSQESGSVTRGGSVTISPQDGGTLYYSVDGATEQSSSTSVAIPITNQDSEHPTTIVARNVVDGTSSASITKTFYMAALDAPTMTMSDTTETANQFPIGGGTVSLSQSQGATIYYTTDGNTPTTSSTQYTGTAIAVASAMTIKAIAHDNYGSSAVAEASYTVVQPKITVTATDATTMSLGETGLTELTINAGTNEFTPSDLGITSFADHVFPSLSFGDNTKIITFDGGGLQVNSLDNAFAAPNYAGGGTNTTLTKCVGIVLAGQDAHASDAFRNCTYLTECELSGVVNGSMTGAFGTTIGNRLTDLDISGLSGHITNCNSMFWGVGCEVIDVSQFTFVKDNAASMFRSCSKLKTIKVGKLEMETANLINLMFFGTSCVTTVICTETTPYTTGWLDKLNGNHALTDIYVPDASVNDYKAHSEWGTYTSIIKGISEYTE